jgi:hypothetical protein
MSSHRLDEESGSVPFMLEEYRHLSSSFLSNKDRSERQVTIFATLVAATIAALSSGRLLLWVAGSASIGVLLFGTITLAHVIKRNIKSDEYLRGLAKVRSYFIGKGADLESYLPFPPRLPEPMRQKVWKELIPFASVGLVESVQLLNSFACAAFLAFLLRSFFQGLRYRYMVVLIALIFTVAWVSQFLYIRWRYMQAKRSCAVEPLGS